MSVKCCDVDEQNQNGQERNGYLYLEALKLVAMCEAQNRQHEPCFPSPRWIAGSQPHKASCQILQLAMEATTPGNEGSLVSFSQFLTPCRVLGRPEACQCYAAVSSANGFVLCASISGTRCSAVSDCRDLTLDVLCSTDDYAAVAAKTKPRV